MKFDDVLPFVRRGVRYQRVAWRSAPRYGLQIDYAGGHQRLVLGHGGLGPIQPWKTAALDVLADDWVECEHIAAARPRTEVEDE